MMRQRGTVKDRRARATMARSMCESVQTRARGGTTRNIRPRHISTQEPPLFEAIAIVLLILWLLGLVTSTVMGGIIHVLFVVAVIMILLAYVDGSGSGGRT
jgi:hypothetical protein